MTKLKKLTTEQVDTLLSFQDWFYSGDILHLAVTQHFPNGEVVSLGIDTLIQEYIRACIASTWEKKNANETGERGSEDLCPRTF